MSKRICSILGCETVHQARGYCTNHYMQAQRQGEFVAEPPENPHRILSLSLDETEGECEVCGLVSLQWGAKRKDGTRAPRCATKQRALQKEWRATKQDREKRNEYHRLYARRYKLKLVEGGREGLLEAAGWACQICAKELTVRTARIDHDHNCCPHGTPQLCGKCIRGVLCNSCNSGIGLLGDDVTGIRAALDYLLTWENIRRNSA